MALQEPAATSLRLRKDRRAPRMRPWDERAPAEAPCGIRMRTAREAPMRRVRYSLATSLDGYIAGPRGEADWIITDPEIDFRALFAQFDTVLIGRRTFEAMG